MIIKERTKEIKNYILRIYVIERDSLYSFGSEIYDNDKNIIEKCETFAITQDIDRANNIFNILADNDVFPRHIYNVIDEIE